MAGPTQLQDLVPEVQPQGSDLCWLQWAHACFTDNGYPFDIPSVYHEVTGANYVWPGDPATFAMMKVCLDTAAEDTGATLDFWHDPRGTQGRNEEGFVDRLEDWDQLVRDGGFYLPTGVYMKDLQPGPNGPYNNWQHWLSPGRFTQGEVMVTVDEDTMNPYDSGQPAYTLAAWHKAIQDNFDPRWCAIAFRFMKAGVPAPPPSVTPVMNPVEQALHTIGGESYMVPQNAHTVRIQTLVQQALRDGGWPV